MEKGSNASSFEEHPFGKIIHFLDKLKNRKDCLKSFSCQQLIYVTFMETVLLQDVVNNTHSLLKGMSIRKSVKSALS